MFLWTAIALGFFGSLHCAAMCGPLALAMPSVGGTRTSGLIGRVVYNLGRVTTYCLLGSVFGVVGVTFAFAGLQRWLSILAGAAILAGLLAAYRGRRGAVISRAIAPVRARLARLLGRRSLGAAYAFGTLNGLLPCGLVYVACAGAVATGGFVSAVNYMFAFGLGTVPMMLGIGLTGGLVRPALRLRFQQLIPACLVLLSVLLILRGLALGIPFVSPALAAGAHCPLCH
jgi:hypothetical protein